MTTEIFTNSATARIADALSPTGLVLTLNDASQWPDPVSGVESFKVSLVQAATSQVEIAEAILRDANTITLVTRGLEGTTPLDFVPGDFAFHSVTAGTIQQVIDAWGYYLGPQASAPETRPDGSTIGAGDYYYDTTLGKMQVWNGTRWTDFEAAANTWYGIYTWQIAGTDHPAGIPLPDPDIYGLSVPVLVDGEDLVNLYYDGTMKVRQENPSTLVGDFVVTFGTSAITPLQNIPVGTIVTALVGKLASAVFTNDFYTKTEIDDQQQIQDDNLTNHVPNAHQHIEADITDLDKYTQQEVDDLIDASPPGAHTHVEADTTDLDKYTQQEVVDLIAAASAVGVATYIAAPTDLIAGEYICTAPLTATLPELSAGTQGDSITFRSQVAATVIVNHHMNDDSGSEIWTGVGKGDYVRFVHNGSLWDVVEHYESHFVNVYLAANNSITNAAPAQLITWTETHDLGGWWASDQAIVPFDAWATTYLAVPASSEEQITVSVKVNSVFLYNPITASVANKFDSGSNDSSVLRSQLEKNDVLQAWGFNPNTTQANNVPGSVAGDKTRFQIKLERIYA